MEHAPGTAYRRGKGTMTKQRYWDKFANLRATRRRVVSGIVGLGASAVAVGLVGCSDDDKDGSTSGESSGTSTGSGGSQPVSDRLVISLNYAGVESNDPRDIGGSASWQLTPL